MGVYPNAVAEHGLDLGELRLLDIRLGLAWRALARHRALGEFEHPPAPWNWEHWPQDRGEGVFGLMTAPGMVVSVGDRLIRVHTGNCRWRWLFCSRQDRLMTVELVCRVLRPLGVARFVWFRDELGIDDCAAGRGAALSDVVAALEAACGSALPSWAETDPTLAEVAGHGQVDEWFDVVVPDTPLLTTTEMSACHDEAERRREEGLKGTRADARQVTPSPPTPSILLLERLIDLAATPHEQLLVFGARDEPIRRDDARAAGASVAARVGDGDVRLCLAVRCEGDSAVIEGRVLRGGTWDATVLGHRRFLRHADGRITPTSP